MVCPEMLNHIWLEVERLHDKASEVEDLVTGKLSDVSKWERDRVDACEEACAEMGTMFEQIREDVERCCRVLCVYATCSEDE